MKKLTLLFCCAVFMWQCKNKLEEPEDQLNHLKGNVAIDMSYTKTETNFRQGASSSIGDGMIDTRTIPIISKQKVQLKIFQDGGSEMYIERIDHSENLFTSNAIQANDVPEPKYYQMVNGIYTVFDKQRNLIFSQPMPELNFDGILKQIRDNVKDVSTLPAMLSGGFLFYDLKEALAKANGGFFKTEAHPLHNKFDDHPDYDVVRETYIDEMDGLVYTQETIIDNRNNSLVWVSQHDASFGILSRTSFGYEQVNGVTQLVNTQSVVFEESEDGEVITHVTLTEYENFILTLNL